MHANTHETYDMNFHVILKYNFRPFAALTSAIWCGPNPSLRHWKNADFDIGGGDCMHGQENSRI